jgi:mycothiol synthase
MPAVIREWTHHDLEPLRALMEDPGLAEQYDIFTGPGILEKRLADPHLRHDCVRMAWVDGEPVGFGFAFVLPSVTGDWSVVRVGVRPPFRRHGIGRALYDAVVEAVKRLPDLPNLVELGSSAWAPCPDAEGFADALGFRTDRWFWLMERPRGGAPEPRWPDGIVTRVFDGSPQSLADWNDAYNDSFTGHYRFVPSSLEDARALAAGPGFRRDGVLLAYRNERCVGFCRCELHEKRGEVGTIGVTHDTRGIGLGRALLRWGVRWLESTSPLPVTLTVDGENEGALGLYRGEGFVVKQSRRIWIRRLAGVGA